MVNGVYCEPGHWKTNPPPAHCETGHEHADAYDGTYYARVLNTNAGGDRTSRSLTKAISTEGFSDIVLSYEYKIEQKIEHDNFVYVEWSPDAGETWHAVKAYTDVDTGSWTSETIVIDDTAAQNNPNFQFRFRGYDLSSSDEFWLDDVVVSGTVITSSPTLSVTPDLTPTPSPSASPDVSPNPEVTPSASPDASPIPSVSPEISPTTLPETSPIATIGGGNAATATITVNKVVMNDGGGTKTISDFPLFIDGFAVQSGVPFTVTGYYHTVTETNGFGYTATFSGACDAGGTVVTSPGDSKTCTITNDDPGKVLGAEIEVSPSPSPSPTGEVLGAQTTTCEAPYLTDYLKMGWNNNPEQVKKLQEFLNQELVSDGVSLPVTGVFGRLTFQAVKLLQTKYVDAILAPWGITDPTGFVYMTTQWFINTRMGCPNLPMPALQ